MVVAIAEPKTEISKTEISKTKIYSADEYLALETASETSNEYRNGEIIPMAGGNPTHNKLNSNLNALLWFGLKGKPYALFIADQRLAIPNSNRYTYPDVMVVPRPIELQTGRKDTVMNPVLIAEVLSDSTEAYDGLRPTGGHRDHKFVDYRTIATFQEYLLIDQSRYHVEHYVKQNATQWLFTECDGQDQCIALTTIPVEIALIDLYDSIEFEGV